MKRTKHSLSHYRLLTADMGKLIPIALYPVLPGDSVQQATSLLLRANPLAAPVMHPVSVRVHHWFVPNRLIWEDWEKFITGGSDGEGDGAVFPTITTGAVTVGSLSDYLGLPVSLPPGSTVSAMPYRVYNLIWNEFYRDQDLQTPLTVPVTGGNDNTSNFNLQSVNWEKDYQTTSRPWPQKGPEITLPLGTEADVWRRPNASGFSAYVSNSQTLAANGALSVTGGGVTDTTPNAVSLGPTAMAGGESGLYADLAAATAVDVNTVRRAFALQRYQEARAMYGSRYTEYLRYLGVRSSDARLQRPEYLGGGKQTISFTEVLQTAPTTDGDDTEGVGNLKGHGIAAMRSRRYRRFFEEHGYVISLLSVRPRAMYVDALNRDWFKNTKEDFWQKELELIGMQEVYNKEVYAGDSGPNDVFGYNDRYAEYRHIPSTVHGEFQDSTLNYWHLARQFGADVTLNSAFITCAPADRIYAAPLTNANLLIMANHSIQARRMVGRSGRTGRIM